MKLTNGNIDAFSYVLRLELLQLQHPPLPPPIINNLYRLEGALLLKRQLVGKQPQYQPVLLLATPLHELLQIHHLWIDMVQQSQSHPILGGESHALSLILREFDPHDRPGLLVCYVVNYNGLARVGGGCAMRILC